MGALLEATATAPPSTIALKLTKDIGWVRVSVHRIIYMYNMYGLLSHCNRLLYTSAY